MRRSLLFVVSLVSAVALLSACGSDGKASSTSEGKQYVDALVKGYDASNAKDVFTRPQAVCISTHVVDAVGMDALKKSGVSPTELAGKGSFRLLGSKLSGAASQRLGNVFVNDECFQLVDVLLKSGAGGTFSRVPKAKVRCIFATLASPSKARQAFANSILGRPGADAEVKAAFSSPLKMVDALSKCKVDPSLIR